MVFNIPPRIFGLTRFLTSPVMNLRPVQDVPRFSIGSQTNQVVLLPKPQQTVTETRRILNSTENHKFIKSKNKKATKLPCVWYIPPAQCANRPNQLYKIIGKQLALRACCCSWDGHGARRSMYCHILQKHTHPGEILSFPLEFLPIKHAIHFL